MPRGKKKNSSDHHGLLQSVEQQYLAALEFSRDQINQKIDAVRAMLGLGNAPAVKGKGKSKGGVKSSGGKRKPRNYDFMKAKLTKPMSMVEMLKALGMKEKQEGTLRATMQNYPGLIKSDGGRPATYTFDSSR